MKVDVIGDEQDYTVPEEAVALEREESTITWAGQAFGPKVGSFSSLLLSRSAPASPTPGSLLPPTLLSSQVHRCRQQQNLKPPPGSAPYQQCQHL